MNSETHNGFAHRENQNGSFDSICKRCYATIATSLREAELEKWEEHHKCDPRVLNRIDRLKREPNSDL